MIVVAKKLSVLQLFISRMPKMCAILQLVSAPLNPIPIAEHFRRSHPQCEQCVWPVLQNLCEILTRSGKELKFVENETVEGYFETTHLK